MTGIVITLKNPHPHHAALVMSAKLLDTLGHIHGNRSAYVFAKSTGQSLPMTVITLRLTTSSMC